MMAGAKKIPSPREIDDSEFLNDDDEHQEAKKRYATWQARDPFPEVKPSLLHSGQIRDYILKTGMLSPFTRDDLRSIKPASLEIPFEGRVVYWDANLKKVDTWISAKSTTAPAGQFTLKRNSIAFVQVKPRFQLPYYIAVRFNLKITHVYRGLLLGTGPLVDPGYQGHLYIPLHNLTDNDYEFLGGEGLLWMEFTKLQWDDDNRHINTADSDTAEAKLPEGFVEFPPYKTDLTLEDFFRKANDNRAIPSSIPQEIQKARVASESAAASVKWIKGIGLLVVIGLLSGLISIFKATWDLAYDVKHKMGDAVIELQNEQDEIQKKLESLSEQIKAISDEKTQEVGDK